MPEELDDLNSVVIEPEAPEPDDDDDDDAAPVAPRAEPSSRPGRKERRQERAANFREMKERSERLERELQETRMAQARMEGHYAANLQRQQPQGPHPLEQELDAVLREQDDFYKTFHATAGTMTEAQRAEAGQRASQLEKKKLLAAARLERAQSGITPPQDPRQQQQVAFQMQVDARFPDLAASPEQVRRWGWARVQQLQLEGRHQNIWDLMDEAAEDTRKQFAMKGTRGAPKPTAETKAKFVSTSKGPSGGGGAENKPIRINKKQAEMAEKAYPNLPSGKAHQKWWNEIGKKYA
jgi:hypothetical protein